MEFSQFLLGLLPLLVGFLLFPRLPKSSGPNFDKAFADLSAAKSKSKANQKKRECKELDRMNDQLKACFTPQGGVRKGGDRRAK